MKLAFALRAIARESRGSRGRLLFVTSCLAVGVAAVVGVAGLVGAIDRGIRSQARELLAADLAVQARRPLPEELDTYFAAKPGVQRTDLFELATMAARPAGDTLAAEESQLAELKVVEGVFPLYGELGLEPALPLEQLLSPTGAVVAPELCESLGVEIGEDLLLGGARFRIAGLVHSEPDRMGFSLALGPRVFLSSAGLERTGLLGFGNRVRYRALFKLPAGGDAAELANVAEELRALLPDPEFVTVETHRDAQPTVRQALGRVEKYLGLVALLSLLLGGTGVAQVVRAWLSSKTRAIAVLRSLGLRPAEVLVLYLTHVGLLALVGSVAGGLVGCLAPSIVGLFESPLLPPGFRLEPSLDPLLGGVALGVCVALLFALPPLTAIWRVSPARVLRSDAEPLPAPRVLVAFTWILFAGGLFATAWYQVRAAAPALYFSAGLLVATLLLFVAARTLVFVAGRIRRDRWNPTLAHGVAAIARPGAGTTGAMVALGVGVLVVTSMALVQRRLDKELRQALPLGAPNVFLVDVQPPQWPGVAELLDAHDAANIDSVPVVMARLSAIDGVDVDTLATERERRSDAGNGRPRWVLTREQRLTYLDELPADNVVIEGQLWSDPDRAEVSLEEGYAEDLGVGVGSTLQFNVEGIQVPLLVSSIRTVEWQSFAINFFLVVEPGVLEAAPHLRLAAAQLQVERESEFRSSLATQFPNVTPIPIREVMEKVRALLERLAFGVRLLGGFTIITGVIILAGAVSAGSLRRGREAALLKTLGITRRGVLGLFATEFALTGAVAGLVGGTGAWLCSVVFLRRGLQLDPDLPWSAIPYAVLGASLLATLFGIAASAEALARRPIETLR